MQRIDEAVVQGQHAVQHDPESFLAKWELAFAYHWQGRHDDAIRMFEPLWATSGHHWVALGLVPAYMLAGREDRARSLYASLVERDAREYVQPFVLAVCATAVGDQEAAIRFCEAASTGATCCSRCSAAGGRTSHVFALTAVTTTSSFASTRAETLEHKATPASDLSERFSS